MANSTFNGPVRSDNGFETISKNATTGAVTIEADYNVRPNFRAAIDNSTFAGAGGATDTLTVQESGTTRVLPLCVALSSVLFSSPNATGPSPKVMISVIAPVVEFLLTVLKVSSDLTGPEKVVFAIIILLVFKHSL